MEKKKKIKEHVLGVILKNCKIGELEELVTIEGNYKDAYVARG